MKPLPSAPLTEEDFDIMTFAATRLRSSTWERGELLRQLDALSWQQDRRDAALMLRLTQTGDESLPHPNKRAVAHSLLSLGLVPWV